jgi:hypothetical protein
LLYCTKDVIPDVGVVLFIVSDIFITALLALFFNIVPSNVKDDSPFILPPPVAVNI